MHAVLECDGEQTGELEGEFVAFTARPAAKG
jgi:hypothetical protein